MKKFVIVQNSIKTVFIFRMSYIKKLLEFGTVYILAPIDCKNSRDKLIESGCIVVELPELKSKLDYLKYLVISNAYILRFRLMGCKFICHFISTFILNYLSLIPFNRNVIIYTEGLGSALENSKVRSVVRFLLRNNRSTRLFCNQDEKNRVGNKDDIVTNGIGIEIYNFPQKKIDVKRIENEKEYRLLYVGRLIEDKGVYDCIEVLKNLRSKGYSVELILVGDVYKNNPSSLNRDNIEQLKREFGEAISFVGFSNNILYWYQYADILLLPSRREGFPVVAMEANAVGLPVIGYDVPGVRDAISNNVNGNLVELKNIIELSEKVELMLNFSTLDRYNKKCREYAKENFS
ncbi:glycosyltransferase, partial [Vibrio proteolyticus]